MVEDKPSLEALEQLCHEHGTILVSWLGTGLGWRPQLGHKDQPWFSLARTLASPTVSVGVEELRELIDRAAAIFENCDVTSGACCCGDDMRGHSSVFNAGHSPVDSGEYAVRQWQDDVAALSDTPSSALVPS